MFFLFLFSFAFILHNHINKKRRLFIMLKNLIRWFIVFGLSFLIADAFTWPQGIAFFILYLIVSFWQFGVAIIATLALGTLGGALGEATGISLALIFAVGLLIALSLILPFIVSKLFGLDFYLVYQVVTFLFCFFSFNFSIKTE